jgi:hypothetical protein
VSLRDVEHDDGLRGPDPADCPMCS